MHDLKLLKREEFILSEASWHCRREWVQTCLNHCHVFFCLFAGSTCNLFFRPLLGSSIMSYALLPCLRPSGWSFGFKIDVFPVSVDSLIQHGFQWSDVGWSNSCSFLPEAISHYLPIGRIRYMSVWTGRCCFFEVSNLTSCKCQPIWMLFFVFNPFARSSCFGFSMFQWCSFAASHVWSLALQRIGILIASSQGSKQLYVPGLHCCRLFWFNLHVYQWYRYQTATQPHHHIWLVSQEYVHPSHSMNFVGFPGFPNHLGHNHRPKLSRAGALWI